MLSRDKIARFSSNRELGRTKLEGGNNVCCRCGKPLKGMISETLPNGNIVAYFRIQKHYGKFFVDYSIDPPHREKIN